MNTAKLYKELEDIKKNQTELKNITEIKNTLEGINSRLDDKEEWISKLKDTGSVEIPETEQKKKNS